MKCIVPLAGPDLYTPEFGLRPLYPVDGEPLVSSTLRMRGWAKALCSSDYVFVVREVPEVGRLCSFLEENWPGSSIVRLSKLTQGALFSVLAAISQVNAEDVVMVDLADIMFSELSSEEISVFSDDVGAIVPVFRSSDPVYSYLRKENGRVIEAREKVVISEDASAGVYVFKNASLFLRAAAHNIENWDRYAFRGALFICPMINGVVSEGFNVLTPTLEQVRPVGKVFK